MQCCIRGRAGALRRFPQAPLSAGTCHRCVPCRCPPLRPAPLLCAAQVDEDVVCGLNQRFRDCYDVDSCDVVVTGIFHQVGTAGREPAPACSLRSAACRARGCRKLARVSVGPAASSSLCVP